MLIPPPIHVPQPHREGSLTYVLRDDRQLVVTVHPEGAVMIIPPRGLVDTYPCFTPLGDPPLWGVVDQLGGTPTNPSPSWDGQC